MRRKIKRKIGNFFKTGFRIKSLFTDIELLSYERQVERRVEKIRVDHTNRYEWITNYFSFLKEKHIKPFDSKDSTFGVKIFNTKCECVKYYINILNTQKVFLDFRRKRALMITQNNMDPLILVNYLSKFATDVDYVKKVKATILKLRNERVQNTDWGM